MKCTKEEYSFITGCLLSNSVEAYGGYIEQDFMELCTECTIRENTIDITKMMRRLEKRVERVKTRIVQELPSLNVISCRGKGGRTIGTLSQAYIFWRSAKGMKPYIKNKKRITDDKGGFVYFLGTDYGTKIGMTINPKQRYATLEKLIPVPILSFRVFEAWDRYEEEKNLHDLFKQGHRKHEWYDLSVEGWEYVIDNYREVDYF